MATPGPQTRCLGMSIGYKRSWGLWQAGLSQIPCEGATMALPAKCGGAHPLDIQAVGRSSQSL
eukprot:6162065-Pleurochrysis_carterae.AAC.2